MQAQLSPHELAYQESLIQERETEIREIETGIHELSEIFRDLGTLVHEQGGMLGQSTQQSAKPVHAETTYSIIDNIESNVYSIAVDTAGAAEELSTASEYQRKAGRRAACLGLIIIIVVVVVLIAVRHRCSLDAPHSTVLTFSADFVVVGGCGCVIIDDSYYGNLVALVYCSLMFSYDTHQLRADLSEAVGVRSQHLPSRMTVIGDPTYSVCSTI
jgi:hypothetical protein